MGSGECRRRPAARSLDVDRVTDAKNNDVDHFSAASKIGDADADGLVVSNVDLHPPVVRTLMEA